MLSVYIGYDSREPEAYEVAKASILKHASVPVNVVKLNQAALRKAGLYRREWIAQGGQKFDVIDGKPFSTEFSFTRFLVPALMQWEGWAVFMDCDQIFFEDIAQLTKEFDDRYALQVCKQDYQPTSGVKMDNQLQEKYFRKNWSSFMAFNCSHPANANLTIDAVNSEPGAWLHGLRWLRDDDIGDLNHGWNWIDGTTKVRPLNVHYTLGACWFPHLRYANQPYFEEWRQFAKEIGIWDQMIEKQDRQAA